MRIRTATLETNCEVSGPRDAPAVLLSHALGTSLNLWDPQMAALESGFRVVRYDIRGHGESAVPPAPYTLAELAEDVVALLDRLEIGRVSFVGVSLGGMIGQELALRHPGRIRRLVLCDTSARVPPEGRQAIRERIALARRGGMAALVDATLARWFTPRFLAAEGPGVALIRRLFLRTPVEGFVGCAEAICGLDLLEALPGIGVPTLVVVGEEDPGTPVAAAQAIHAAIPGSRLEVIPSASHLANVEQASRFNRLLVDFLTAAEAR